MFFFSLGSFGCPGARMPGLYRRKGNDIGPDVSDFSLLSGAVDPKAGYWFDLAELSITICVSATIASAQPSCQLGQRRQRGQLHGRR